MLARQMFYPWSHLPKCFPIFPASLFEKSFCYIDQASLKEHLTYPWLLTAGIIGMCQHTQQVSLNNMETFMSKRFITHK